FAEGGRESDGNRGRLGLLPKERLGRTHRQKEQGQKEQGPVQWPVLALIGDEVQDQIRGVALDFHPERLIIEPSTAAAVPGVLEGIRRVSIEGFVRRIRRILVLDASTFGKYYASSTRFVESRIEVSDLVVVNKCDLVEPREALWIQDVVGRVNREARALLASFGRVDGEEFRSEALPPELDDGKAEIECCSSAFTGAFDRDALLVLFEEFRRSDIGRVSRAKGVFRTAEGWVQIDYANGEVIVQTAADSAVSRIALIGVGIDWIQLDSKLNCCLLADLHSVEGCDNGGM
ncbi:MAG: GTP-binding protein, partial [Chloroflexi bacterium]|nr:GTP-binding protein [Chloroflexota bacterium]